MLRNLNIAVLQKNIKRVAVCCCLSNVVDHSTVLYSRSKTALLNQCARCTLGCAKICVGCTTTKRFTRVHHALVTLKRYFLQKLSVRKNEPLTNQ